MYNLIKILTIATLFISLISFSSCDFTGPPRIIVKDVKLVPSQLIEGTASGFMLISNEGDISDKLRGCSVKESFTARGRLHEVIGSEMRIVQEIIIPAGETVSLEQGSIHLMFFGLPDVMENEVILVLDFKRSGLIEVKAQVEKLQDDTKVIH